MYAHEDKVKGCLVGGGVGDPFGAPIEALFSEKEIKKRYGAQGLTEFAYYKSAWDDGEREGFGIITDDTTMTACTLAAVITAADKKNFEEASLDAMWNYYMLWGQNQKYGHVIKKAAVISMEPPDYLKPFLFRCGAGLNTLAGLSVGYRGDVDRPLKYKRTIDKKVLKSPNRGCGAQMRTAPIAFLYDEVDLIPYSARMAAITHSHPDAIAASVGTTVLVANALKCKNLRQALIETKKDFAEIPNNEGIFQSWDLAEQAFTENIFDMKAMSALGKKQKIMQDGKLRPNAFLALPVLTQTLFAVQAAAVKKPTPNNFKDVIRLAANHTGDSDSVAAIVGNVVGASWGYGTLPKDWIDAVQQKDDILHLGEVYLQTAQKANLAP